MVETADPLEMVVVKGGAFPGNPKFARTTWVALKTEMTLKNPPLAM
jgi:hypothetical protein